MSQHELHPLCTLFPRLSGGEFNALRDDIAANGLRQPITTHNGMILDGGNRYRACIEAGVKPKFTEFTGQSIGAFVLSANMHRRHLSAGQQAAIVASVQSWAEAQPATRPKKGCNIAPLSTVADRMAQSGASERTQKMADKVARASPDMAKRVAHGEISLPKAARELDPPSKPAEKPELKAAKPKKGEPTVESLTAEVESLKADLHEARNVARDLAQGLESYDTVSEGEHAAARELKKLKGMLHAVETQRDQWMTTCSELRREVKSLQRKAGTRQ